jgi:U6 snRNA-associated Sm-like protein LSm6
MDTEEKTSGEFMRQLFGKHVQIQLTNSEEFKGKLVSLDGAMNIVLEKAEEYHPGSPAPVKIYDQIFLRGNNGNPKTPYKFHSAIHQHSVRRLSLLSKVENRQIS